MHEHFWFAGRGGPFRRHHHHHFRHGRHDFFVLFGGPPPRADRGVVRYLILDAIAERPRHGYEIIQTISERSGGTYKPSAGVVYPTLQMLEELGHAKLEEREGRKVYAITEAGRRDLADHQYEVDDFYATASESSWEDVAMDMRELVERAARMFKMIGSSARRGRLTPTTIKKLRAVLDDTITRIEEILDPHGR